MVIARVPRVCGGDPYADGEKQRLARVFPVYAGVIPIDKTDNWVSLRVPRVCGGDP